MEDYRIPILCKSQAVRGSINHSFRQPRVLQVAISRNIVKPMISNMLCCISALVYLSVFVIKRGSSSPRGLHNWITLESFSSLCPRMERPCLVKHRRFDRTFSKCFLLVAFTSLCSADKCSPTSRVFADITCVCRHHVCSHIKSAGVQLLPCDNQTCHAMETPFYLQSHPSNW